MKWFQCYLNTAILFTNIIILVTNISYYKYENWDILTNTPEQLNGYEWKVLTERLQFGIADKIFMKNVRFPWNKKQAVGKYYYNYYFKFIFTVAYDNIFFAVPFFVIVIIVFDWRTFEVSIKKLISK